MTKNTHAFRDQDANTSIKSVKEFRAEGGNLAEWARQRGFNQQLVYLVASGNRKCLRGESFKIAKELGMK